MNQGKTEICWSFATSSFVESEMARLKLEPVRLSVLYPLYCAYLEKARRFVQTKGASRFAAGDLFTGVPGQWQKYGALPASVYDRFKDGARLDHSKLYKELENVTKKIKQQDHWDEAAAVAQVAGILNRYLGEPPQTFSFNGKTYSPNSFLAEVVRLPWNEYLMITSFESAPFNTFTDLKVPDNWRQNTNFFNVPLSVYYNAFKDAIRAGFTVAVSIDTTEPSYKTTGRYCLIPDSDIPPAKIDQEAREARFLSHETTDDHAIHIIGYNNSRGEDWFLAKDSWKTVWRDGNKGDLFLHSSYVELKILAFIVHRDGVPAVTALIPRR
jgi:bleomycin hydrolase